MPNDRTAISVLIACYNAAPFVRAAIESVLQQTFQNFEIIVIDDGSTDGTREVLASLSDPRLKVISQPNRGASSARNTAFAACQGEQVIYFDADDIMHPKHLESLYRRSAASSLIVPFSPWIRFKGDHQALRFESRPSQTDMSGPDWLVCEWTNARQMMQSAMFLLPRSMIENYGGWDESLSLNDDFEFFGRILSQAEHMTFAAEAGLYYRSAVFNSLSAKRSANAITSAFHSVHAGTSHLLAKLNSAEARLACANCLQDFVYITYPGFPEYRRITVGRISELGGSNLPPDGPPGFQKLRRIIGWKSAKRVQKLAETLKLNKANRSPKRQRAHSDKP
ncbi:MAG: glycosyltransferase family 2 protein [Rhodocyclaceae bacterium]|nr:glycosyltransferase family 2 protein [Rhodocyclaceae bacterium]